MKTRLISEMTVTLMIYETLLSFLAQLLDSTGAFVCL